MYTFMKLSQILEKLNIPAKNPDDSWRTFEEIEADLKIAWDEQNKEYDNCFSE